MKKEEKQQIKTNSEPKKEKKKSAKTVDKSLSEKKTRKTTTKKKQTKNIDKDSKTKKNDTKESKPSTVKKTSSSKKKTESKTKEKISELHIDTAKRKQKTSSNKKEPIKEISLNKANKINYFSKVNVLKRKLNSISRDIKLRYRIYKTKLQSKKAIYESNRRYKKYYKDSIRFGKSVKSTISKTKTITITSKPEVTIPKNTAKSISAPIVKPKNKIKKQIDKHKLLSFFRKAVLLLLIGYIVCSIVYYYPEIKNYFNIKKEENAKEVKEEEVEVVEEVKQFADIKYRSIFVDSYNKAYNKDDFIGQIIFESGIINEPVVQANDNDYYLRRNYETLEYEIAGPIFVDCDCNVYIDNNAILYGHDFPKESDPEQKLFFTPLHLLTEEENYEDNKIISFVLRDRVETYLICYVYDIAIIESVGGDQYLVEGEPIYYNNNYSSEELKEYLDAVEERKMYDTDNTINIGDKLLTLQTCYEDRIDKLIVLAKLVDTKYFEESVK